MIQIGWPQLIWLSIMVVNLAVTISKHGDQKKPETYNGWTTAIAVCLVFGLLYWGGFFG